MFGENKLVNDKELSIIVPVYNCEKYLERCIESLLNQGLEQYEIILVDDGSTDSSAQICDSYKDNKHVIVIHKENEGQGVARNVGISLAKGKYITFVDSDDFINANSYIKIVRLMEDEKAQICTCRYKKISESQAQTAGAEQTSKFQYKVESDSTKVLAKMLDENYQDLSFAVTSSTCDKVYLKELIDEYNVRFLSEREYISEDILFNCQFISKSEKTIVSDLYTYNYVQNDASYCHVYQEGYVDRMLKMQEGFDKYIGVQSNAQYLEKYVYIKLFSYLKSCIIQEIEHKSFKESCNQIRNIVTRKGVTEVLCGIDESLLDSSNRLLFKLIVKKRIIAVNVLYRLKLKRSK